MEELIKELKFLEEQVMQCMKCGTCQAHCPLYQKDQKESSVARGKIMLIESIYEGRLEEAEGVLKHIDFCLLCGRCKHNCPSGVKTDEIFLKSKSILRKIKKMPAWQKAVLRLVMEKPEMLAKVAPFMHMGLKFGSKKIKDGVFKPLIGSFSERHVTAVQKTAFCTSHGGFHEADNEKHKVIFYPGCATNLMFVDSGKAIIKVLNHYGVSVYVPKVNKCCGIPAATMGDNELYGKMVEENYAEFDTFEGADIVVTCCPTCQYGLDEMGAKVSTTSSDKSYLDILVYLKEILHIDTTVKMNEKTSLHVPCHYTKSKLGVLNNFVTETIQSDFVPLEDQGCCGFGGTFNIKHYKDSKAISISKVDEIKEKEIKKLFTPCPGCAMQLTDNTLSGDASVDVLHPIMALVEGIE